VSGSASGFRPPTILGVVFTMVQLAPGDKPFNAAREWIHAARKRRLPLFESTFRFNNGLFSNAGEANVPSLWRRGGTRTAS
jgi:hypothetical protein